VRNTERRPDLSKVEDGCPDRLLAAMQQCWHDTPDQRPTFKKLVHEFAALASKPSSPTHVSAADTAAASSSLDPLLLAYLDARGVRDK